MAKIHKIESSNENISGRGGITFFLRYIEQIGFLKMTFSIFNLAPAHKGLTLLDFLKQMMAHFMVGDSMAITDFDHKKKDAGYAAVLETKKDKLASSHQIKRFFIKISQKIAQPIYRRVLSELFVWRLKKTNPEVIILGIDTMVLDNDQALKRKGCEPTYKKKKGFQPLHISWGHFLIDVIFRKGSTHSNHGNDYIESIEAIAKLIRTRYRDVPIILVADGGFFDQKAFDYFEDNLKIAYIVMDQQPRGRVTEV